METTQHRSAPLEMSSEEFRAAGHELVDRISEFLDWIHDRTHPVTRAETPKQIRELLGTGSLLDSGSSPRRLLQDTANLLFDHSLFNGHPKFWGYISSSAAPIGMLGDLLASAVNPNCGAFALSPVATEMERQVVRWIAEMIGYPTTCSGILVSGGNTANFVCFLAARKAKTPWDVRRNGTTGPNGKTLRVYCSTETHTWIQKATDMYGLGTDAIAWIPVDDQLRMNIGALRTQIQEDLNKNFVPFVVIGAAGTVGTGAIDPIADISAVCREYDLWFHVDGAYGGFAAVLPDAPADLKVLSLADSVAVDPHKWLYAPLEVGCTLVKNPHALREAFSYHPTYYRFDDHAEEDLTNFYELGPQNSRGFRALKVWLAFKQAGKEGYGRMIHDDCALAKELFREIQKHPDLEALTHNLSITTFRYAPRDLQARIGSVEEYLNKLNTELLARLQTSGAAYPSNALIDGKYAIRVCIVNFRTTLEDIRSLPALVLRTGAEVDREMRPKELNVT